MKALIYMAYIQVGARFLLTCNANAYLVQTCLLFLIGLASFAVACFEADLLYKPENQDKWNKLSNPESVPKDFDPNWLQEPKSLLMWMAWTTIIASSSVGCAVVMLCCCLPVITFMRDGSYSSVGEYVKESEWLSSVVKQTTRR